MPALIEHWRARSRRSVRNLTITVPTGPLALRGEPPSIELPEVLLQAEVLTLGSKTHHGQLVEAVAAPWFEIIRHLEKDPDFLFKADWRKLEEIIAAAYKRAGWSEVVLTPRSGDGGRDIVATKPGIVSVRLFDQVKAYRKGHVVTAEEVDAMVGVLTKVGNVSKGVVTTTSRFAPGIEKDAELQKLVPYRLELIDGDKLRAWLLSIASHGATAEPG